MFKINLKTILIGILIAEIATVVLASSEKKPWEEPTASPPSENISTPLNTSATTQSKEAGLGVEGLFMKGDIEMKGRRIKNVAGPTNDFDAVTKGYLLGKLTIKCTSKYSGWGYQHKSYFSDCALCGKDKNGNCNSCDHWYHAAASVSCDPGWYLTGGGCGFNTDEENFLENYHHYPTSDRTFYCEINGWVRTWWGAIKNGKPSVRATATCCQ